MSALPAIENPLNDLFVKKAPALPEGGKRFLVTWLPWINLVFGLLSLFAAWSLWHWAHYVNNLIDYGNQFGAAYSPDMMTVDRLNFGVWLSVIMLVIQGALYLAAFPATRDRKRSGWDLMFYALLVNVVYDVAVLFTDYGTIGSFISTLVGAALTGYLLFQIRASYLKSPKHAAVKK